MKLTEFDMKCLDLLAAMPDRHSKHCFRSALFHIEKAESLYDIDPAMAAFRAITAEEEAGSGLMHCLKERGYIGSELLKPKDHFYKNSIPPFFDVLAKFFSQIFNVLDHSPTLVIGHKDGKERLKMALPLLVSGELIFAYPNPPLQFSVKGDGKPPTYKNQIQELVESKGTRTIRKHLKERANMRNKILYAGPDGYPSNINVTNSFYTSRHFRVLSLIKAYLLIQPYKEKIIFVQDALSAFLYMIEQSDIQELHTDV